MRCVSARHSKHDVLRYRGAPTSNYDVERADSPDNSHGGWNRCRYSRDGFPPRPSRSRSWSHWRNNHLRSWAKQDQERFASRSQSRQRMQHRSNSRHWARSSSRCTTKRDKDREVARRARKRKRGSTRELKAAQQAQMQMAMMQNMMGVHHPAMQFAMMQQMGQAQPPFMITQQRKSRRPKPNSSKREDSASSSSSSSESSSNCAERLWNPAAAMAAMAAMWSTAPVAASGSVTRPNSVPPHGVLASAAEQLEVFLSENVVDPETADRLRAMPPHLQQSVIRQGPVSDMRNLSATLKARIRDVELGCTSTNPADYCVRHSGISFQDERASWPARRNAKMTIEAMIRDHRLSPGCAWMLRALPPDKQKLAARIDPVGQADPSGYVAEQLKKIV